MKYEEIIAQPAAWLPGWWLPAGYACTITELAGGGVGRGAIYKNKCFSCRVKVEKYFAYFQYYFHCQLTSSDVFITLPGPQCEYNKGCIDAVENSITVWYCRVSVSWFDDCIISIWFSLCNCAFNFDDAYFSLLIKNTCTSFISMNNECGTFSFENARFRHILCHFFLAVCCHFN